MAVDKLVDSTQLDACCTAEANAIRAKTGGSSQIAYDWANSKGFADAIAAIPSGGGSSTSVDVETSNIRMVWAEVTVGANTVTKASQVVPYLLGLAGFPTSDYRAAWFGAKTYAAYFNNMAICSEVSQSANDNFSKFYRYRNGAPASTTTGVNYDASLAPGDVYYIGCVYWKGAPT